MCVLSVLSAATIAVVDADTIEQHGVRWRIAGIDAPEIHSAKCAEERRRGILAAARLIALIGERGARINPVTHPRSGRPTIDRYGAASDT
ncbi:MAG: hypothetical protein KGP27_15800 [Hyphomicrobiales bacterium]|nr:hypothetical protein [Hyphomicrobiales bacterium]